MDRKIEVDPRLFITCRLCLDELGIYQIVPAVKEQILYCFDINVEPFDGLPQLICKKCEVILNNYAAIKKTIVTKQNELLTKVKEYSNSQTPELGSTALNHKDESHEEIRTSANSTKRKKLCISSSSSDSECGNESDSVKDTTSQIDVCTAATDNIRQWTANYKKHYVCRICDSRWESAKSVLGHFSAKHNHLRQRYKNIFKRHCEVKLYSFGNKLNITGSANNIMLSKEKIISNKNSKFYIMYTPKNENISKKTSNSNKSYSFTRNIVKNINDECSDSSDDDILAAQSKKRRLYSRSSNETVILDDGTKSNLFKSVTHDAKESQKVETENKSLNVSECINIDDSSDSEGENRRTENIENKTKSKSKHQEVPETKHEHFEVNFKAINEIIAGCKSKYIKKRFYNESMLRSNKIEIATQLKRKFLSIGRKIITNKKSLNCTPLLRFLEYKNLDIIWYPRSIMHVNVDTNYNLRIMSRMKNLGETDFIETGWSDYNDNISDATLGQSLSIPLTTPSEDVSKDTEGKSNGTETPECSFLTITKHNDNGILYGTDTKKLLNANPVANPKQLPKKILNNIEAKLMSKKQIISNIEVTPNKNITSEMCLPIITSTTSLAKSVIFNENKNTTDNTSEVSTSQVNINNVAAATAEAVPKFLKVKPVTELMSQETLSRMKEPSGTIIPCIVNSGPPQMAHLDNNNMLNIYMPDMNAASPQYNPLQINNLSVNVFQPEAVGTNNFVILDTVELPNSRTNSPFDYFRRLLQVHNITLLDIDAKPPQDFHCLLKFKVLFKQEPEKQPVILSLSLFCSKNVFLLSIKDRHQENINITKISANWQWEVLKVYRGDVVNKILDNARKIGTEVYDYTNRFLCLLKSINNVKSS